MSESTSFVQLVVGFFLSVTGIHVIVACPVEMNPPSVVVKYGDPVLVNCSTTTTIFDSMGWEASLANTGLMEVRHVTWKVDSLKQWTVSPKCYLNEHDPNQADGTQCHKSLPVVVYKFPENITISSSAGSDGLMKEGTEYNLTCDILDIAPVQNLTVRWYKGNKTIRIDTFDSPTKEPVNQSSVLSFIPKRQDNRVKFRCEAELDLEPEGPHYSVFSQEYPITVHFGPVIQCSTIEILEGETLEGRCAVTGNPSPTISWLKAGEAEPMDHTVPLRRENAGLYTIEAEGATLVNKTLQVLVLYGPELNCPSTYTAVEYAPHNFSCTVQGYPKPETTWYKDDDEVEPPENLTRSDAGQYMITASNFLASVSHTVEISVLYPPTKIVELEDAEVEVGSTLWLKCSSTGNPRPNYAWIYYRTANVKEESEDGVSRLHIYNVTAHNIGSYTCYAGNERGSVSKTVMVTVKGANFECPIKINPDRVVVQYQSQGLDVTCSPTSTESRNVKEIYWQVSQGIINVTRLFLSAYEDWDPRPVCTATFEGIGTCTKPLDFTMYKTPDSVSIHAIHNMGPVVEGTQYQLQCDIISIAPVQNLTVRWYQGNETMKINDELQVTGCPSQYDTDCDITVRTPVNVSSSINITVGKKHTGEEFRCEAHLDLGPDGPQSLPTMSSTPLNITVYYKPIINASKLPNRIPLFRGYPEDLICEAEGHPPPRIQWQYSSEKVPHESGGTLTVFEEGYYTCNATNDVGFSLYEVEVILNEDYLPLIAGFVAVTVVIISIIFVFIYSIYYKNTKMRRYSLKNPKLNTQNGNVAHNGLDLQFPMTKLS